MTWLVVWAQVINNNNLWPSFLSIDLGLTTTLHITICSHCSFLKKSSPDYILDKNIKTAFFKDENKIYHTSISNTLLMTKNDDKKWWNKKAWYYKVTERLSNCLRMAGLSWFSQQTVMPHNLREGPVYENNLGYSQLPGPSGWLLYSAKLTKPTSTHTNTQNKLHK